MIEYREEYNLMPMIDEIAATIQRKVDQAALDKAADTLAKFGYVKVNKNNLTWLYESDAWFQSIVMFATATKMRDGDTIPEFGSMEELSKWLLAEHEKDLDAY